MERSRRPWGRAAVMLCAGALALALGGCDQVMSMVRTKPADRAIHRVDFILGTLAKGVGGTSREMQTAICRWDADEVLVERDSLGVAMDAFDDWRRGGGFYDGVESYVIDPEADPGDPDDPEGTVYLYVTVNGRSRWLRVPPKARISWAESDEA